MILSDGTIKDNIKSGKIVIEPFNAEQLQPASYDLTLGDTVLIFDTVNHTEIDVKQPIDDMMRTIKPNKDGYFVIHPNEFMLAHVQEITGVDSSHVGRLEGKSSLARLGLVIHTTAGFLDPGNRLRMTLEIVNLGDLPIRLYPGMKIAQIAFEMLDKPCEKPYGSKGLGNKYQGDMTVQASKMHQNFTK